MTRRPKSVTIIAWILIVMFAFSAIGIVTVFLTGTMKKPEMVELMRQNHLPIFVQYGLNVAGLLITLVSAVGMLRGKKWARLLYVIWGIIGFLLAFVTSPTKIMIIPGILLFIIFVFFLFRPKANAYFKGTTGTVSDVKNI
jgi:hypothetical protein